MDSTITVCTILLYNIEITLAKPYRRFREKMNGILAEFECFVYRYPMVGYPAVRIYIFRKTTRF